MIALALQLSDSDRDDVLSLGHFALDVVEHLALEEHHRVVVANSGLEQSLRIGRSAGRANL